MPIVYDIVQLGHPCLREIAEHVQDPLDPAIQALIEGLIETCEAMDGVGIAAPQVGHSLQLFIIASKPNSRYPHAPKLGPLAVINPVIISASQEVEKGWEGCLSIPGIRGLVPRHKWVDVSFTNRDGEQKEMRFEGFVARIFQHEYDHIHGMVFVDKTDPKDLVTEQEYQKIKPS